MRGSFYFRPSKCDPPVVDCPLPSPKKPPDMKTRNGFILLKRSEFKKWMMRQTINRKVTMIQNHHTWLPDYTTFNDNHFEQVQGMKNFHVNQRGWSDIGQHITTFPDGMIIVGTRPFERAPAGIKGHNDEAICVEHLGNFDKRKDVMTEQHRRTVVHVNSVLNLVFGLVPNTDHNVYHHWFDLSTLQKTGGSGNTKSCPGTNFFGGNKMKDFKENLLPLIEKDLKGFPEFEEVFRDRIVEDPIGYAIVVRANSLNVRKGPGARFRNMGKINRGTNVDIYEKKGRWTRISTGKDKRWVSSYFLRKIWKGVIIDEDPKGLSVRTGPGREYRKITSLLKDTKVTIYDQHKNGWYRIDFLDKWVSGKYVKLV